MGCNSLKKYSKLITNSYERYNVKICVMNVNIYNNRYEAIN